MTTTITAPRGVKRAGVGAHLLKFTEAGTCPDPGLNAGERAYMQGLGYTFTVAAAAAPAEPEPVEAPKPRRSRARKPAAPKPEGAPAE